MAAKILIVVGDEDFMLGLGARLRATGYEVLVAFDAATAAAIAREDRPDLVVLDSGLPGDGGASLLERLRAQPGTARTPAIMLGAAGAEDLAERTLTAAATTFLQRPADILELLAAIASVLARHQP